MRKVFDTFIALTLWAIPLAVFLIFGYGLICLISSPACAAEKLATISRTLLLVTAQVILFRCIITRSIQTPHEILLVLMAIDFQIIQRITLSQQNHPAFMDMPMSPQLQKETATLTIMLMVISNNGGTT